MRYFISSLLTVISLMNCTPVYAVNPAPIPAEESFKLNISEFSLDNPQKIIAGAVNRDRNLYLYSNEGKLTSVSRSGSAVQLKSTIITDKRFWFDGYSPYQNLRSYPDTFRLPTMVPLFDGVTLSSRVDNNFPVLHAFISKDLTQSLLSNTVTTELFFSDGKYRLVGSRYKRPNCYGRLELFDKSNVLLAALDTIEPQSCYYPVNNVIREVGNNHENAIYAYENGNFVEIGTHVYLDSTYNGADFFNSSARWYIPGQGFVSKPAEAANLDTSSFIAYDEKTNSLTFTSNDQIFQCKFARGVPQCKNQSTCSEPLIVQWPYISPCKARIEAVKRALGYYGYPDPFMIKENISEQVMLVVTVEKGNWIISLVDVEKERILDQKALELTDFEREDYHHSMEKLRVLEVTSPQAPSRYFVPVFFATRPSDVEAFYPHAFVEL